MMQPSAGTRLINRATALAAIKPQRAGIEYQKLIRLNHARPPR